MAKAKGEFEAPCQFGGVSYGYTTARIGITILREHINFTQGDRYLSGSRLTLKCISYGVQHDDGDGTVAAGKKASAEIEASIDVKGFTVKRKSFSFGLTFNTENMSQKQKEVLIKFAKSSGHLLIVESEKLKEQTTLRLAGDEDETESGDE